MAREPKIPLSAVKLLIEQQNTFNKSLVDLLGQYLVQAADKYDRALNPPLTTSDGPPMTYSQMSEEEEQLEYMIESGQIKSDDIPEALRRMTKDTNLSFE